MSTLFRVAAIVAVVGCIAACGWSAIVSGDLPGQPADSTLIVSLRAGAWGPCTATGVDCTGNRPENVTCIEETDGTCTSQSGGAACGTCDGDPHVTCKSTDETPCTDGTVACCQTQDECHTAKGPPAHCKCVTDGGMQWIGIRIQC